MLFFSQWSSQLQVLGIWWIDRQVQEEGGKAGGIVRRMGHSSGGIAQKVDPLARMSDPGEQTAENLV